MLHSSPAAVVFDPRSAAPLFLCTRARAILMTCRAPSLDWLPADEWNRETRWPIQRVPETLTRTRPHPALAHYAGELAKLEARTRSAVLEDYPAPRCTCGGERAVRDCLDSCAIMREARCPHGMFYSGAGACPACG